MYIAYKCADFIKTVPLILDKLRIRFKLKMSLVIAQVNKYNNHY